MKETAFGLLLPWLGTTLGAACVFFMRGKMRRTIQRALTGFAAGVMVAASIWSLLIPAMEQAKDMGTWAFVPAALGFWLGILFLLLLDCIIPHLHMNSPKAGTYQASIYVEDANYTPHSAFVQYQAIDPVQTAATGDDRPIEMMLLGLLVCSAMAAAAFFIDSKRRVSR